MKNGDRLRRQTGAAGISAELRQETTGVRPSRDGETPFLPAQAVIGKNRQNTAAHAAGKIQRKRFIKTVCARKKYFMPPAMKKRKNVL